MARSRAWLLVLAAPVAMLGLLVLLGLALLWTLRPAPADPELAARTTARDPDRPALAVRTGAPASGGCALAIDVRSPEGLPAADAEVLVEGRDLDGASFVYSEASDEAGAVVWEDLPCARVSIEASGDGTLAMPVQTTLRSAGEATLITLQLMEGVVVEGTITGPEGEPVSDAHITAWTVQTQTDTQGHYRLTVPTINPRIWVRAEAFGYDPRQRDTRVEDAPPGTVVQLDIELVAVHHVRVHCAGMPEDDCGDVFLSCTEAFVPIGDACRRWESIDEMVCTCPDGDAAIRGGGRSVLVGPQDEDAWLDFRNTGSIVGALTHDGAPAPGCDVATIRIPSGLEDLPRGLFAARRETSQSDGSFEIRGLVEGDWQLEITCLDPHTAEMLERSSTPMAVRARRETDVGTWELLGGGGIEGVLMDGLTGEPIPHHPVMALREGDRGQRRAPAMADSDSQGRFSMAGLPPGRWTLTHPLSPHMRTTVVVEDGVITDGVVIETGKATALEENGFSVASEDQELVVSGVEEGSPAWDAGLLEGDVIDGVLIAGLDVGSMLGDLDSDLTRLVLGQWDGPGVTLVVDREGELVEIPLEW